MLQTLLFLILTISKQHFLQLCLLSRRKVYSSSIQMWMWMRMRHVASTYFDWTVSSQQKCPELRSSFTLSSPCLLRNRTISAWSFQCNLLQLRFAQWQNLYHAWAECFDDPSFPVIHVLFVDVAREQNLNPNIVSTLFRHDTWFISAYVAVQSILYYDWIHTPFRK